MEKRAINGGEKEDVNEKKKSPKTSKQDKKTKQVKEKKVKEKKVKEKKQKEDKPPSPVMAASVTAVTFILIISTAIALVFFDVGGSKAMVLSILQGDEEQMESEREIELSNAEKDVKAREDAVSEKEEQQNAKQTELDERESSLDSREAIVSGLENDTVNRDASLAELATVYAKMDAKSAANIISSIKNNQDSADILVRMPNSKVAMILEEMDPTLAADLTLLMRDSTWVAEEE